MEQAAATARPRVTGEREQEIFEATLELLVEGGYDRLTLDGVAARAKASKATLYRRWSNKCSLVLEAVSCLTPEEPTMPDTGSLRGDLMELAREKGLLEPDRADVFCGLATAMYRDAELREALAHSFMDPRKNHFRTLMERARARGEIREDANLDLLSQVGPALMIFQLHLVTPGQLPPNFVRDVLDQVVMPALMPGRCPHAAPDG
jgi:AcrR family transcriptional regulator